MTVGAFIYLCIGPVLQFALVLVFCSRRFFLLKFPAFFRYIIFSVAVSVLIIGVRRHLLLYFWVYWISQVIYGLLALLVMREVFQMLWDMKRGLRGYLFWTMILALSLASAWWGFHHSDEQDILTALEPACRMFAASVHALEVILCGLAIFLVRKLTRYHIGIMLGFGVSAIPQVVAYFGHFFNLSTMFKEALIYAPLAAYIAAAGTWLFTFLYRPKPSTTLEPVDLIEWIGEQEKIARQISSGVGLEWPRKEKDNGSKPCTAPA